MLTKFDNLLQKIANWKTVLALFVISFPIGYYIERPLFYKIGQIDYYYSYTADRVYSLISYFHLVGELKKYVTYQLTYQVFFPFVTALFFITFIYHAGNGLVSKKTLVPFALIIPTTTLLVDYLENAGLIIIIRSSYEKPGLIMDYLSFASKLRNTVEITSGFATIKGFLWDMQFLVFIAGITIYIFKMIRFSLNKTGILEKFERKLSYALPISSMNSDDFDKDFENKIKEQTDVMQTKARELSKAEAKNNINALVEVIGFICILALIVIFLRSVSPYVSY